MTEIIKVHRDSYARSKPTALGGTLSPACSYIRKFNKKDIIMVTGTKNQKKQLNAPVKINGATETINVVKEIEQQNLIKELIKHLKRNSDVKAFAPALHSLGHINDLNLLNEETITFLTNYILNHKPKHLGNDLYKLWICNGVYADTIVNLDEWMSKVNYSEVPIYLDFEHPKLNFTVDCSKECIEKISTSDPMNRIARIVHAGYDIHPKLQIDGVYVIVKSPGDIRTKELFTNGHFHLGMRGIKEVHINKPTVRQAFAFDYLTFPPKDWFK